MPTLILQLIRSYISHEMFKQAYKPICKYIHTQLINKTIRFTRLSVFPKLYAFPTITSRSIKPNPRSNACESNFENLSLNFAGGALSFSCWAVLDSWPWSLEPVMWLRGGDIKREKDRDSHPTDLHTKAVNNLLDKACCFINHLHIFPSVRDNWS